MTHSIPRAVLLGSLLLGCSADAQRTEVVRTDGVPAPASRGTLRVDSEQPLAFGHMLSLDSTTLVGTDRVTNDVWLIDASAATVRVTRVLDGAERVRARLVAISADEREWRLVDRSGTMYRFERDSWAFIGQSAIEFGIGSIISGTGDGEGGFALLLRQPMLPNRASIEQVLVLVDRNGTPRATWRSGALARTGGGGDMISLSRSADGWVIAGSSPPRVLHFDAAGVFEHELPFGSVPVRRLSREVREQFRRTAAAAGLAAVFEPPSQFPAITRLRQVGSGYLAVPLVGGSTGEAEGLDWYCGARFQRTIFDSPLHAQILPTTHGVVVVSESSEPAYLIDYYRMTDLPLDCGADS